MTLSNTIRFIERVALSQPAIKTVVPNDIFRLNAMPDAEYAVFGWTQGTHSVSIDESFATYAFTFFYIDRLTEDLSNQVEIQSVGVQVLDNIVRTLEAYGAHPSTTCNYTTFNQRFLDETAGVFVSVSLQVPLNGVCEEGYYDFNEDFNDDFATSGQSFGAEGFGGSSCGGYGGGIVVPGGSGSGSGGCGCDLTPYLKYHLCASLEEYNEIEYKDPWTLYLIPEEE